MSLSRYLLPLSSAAIGWLSITVTIRLAFRALAQRRAELAAAISDFADIDPNDLVAKVEQVDMRGEVAALLQSRVDNVMNKFVQQTPMAAMFLNDGVKNRIKELVISEILAELPQLQKNLAQRMISELDLKKWLQTKIESLDFDQLETKLRPHIRKSMCTAQTIGAGIGLFMGLLQILFLHLGA